MVSECSEFHNIGEYHEGITSVDEAVAVFHQIPPERMNGIWGIGINIHTEGTERYEDVEIDILSGNVIDLEILDCILDITGNPKAMEIIAELVEKVPGAEVRGSLEKWETALPETEYKSLAKVDEVEETSCNMIDDVLNNGVGEKEKECLSGRISIKEKLAEKRAVVEQRDRSGRRTLEKDMGRSIHGIIEK